MKPITAWSYSRWSCYETCPLQFKLRYIDKLPEPPSAPMERGDRIHKGIAAYLVGKAAEPPKEAVQHAAHAKLVAELHAFEDKAVEQQWGFTAQWSATGWFGKDTWLRSVLDVAVMYEDMTAEVIDWKTGKRYGSNDAQMELFALSLMSRFKPVIHVTTRLAYLDTGDEEIAEFPAACRDSLKDKWSQQVKPMFADTVFAPRPNDKCRFCHFSRSNSGACRFG